MSIRDYLALKSLTVAAFAERVGVGRVIVHSWMSGAKVPSLESAAKIVAVTGGEVTIDDLLAPSQPAADASTTPDAA